MSILRQPLARYVALASTVFLVLVHYLNMQAEFDAARTYFIRSAANDAQQVGRKVENAFASIHRNITTIARAPATIKLRSADSTLDAESRTRLKQVFDDLVRDVPVSKLYISALGPSPDAKNGATIATFTKGLQPDSATLLAANAERRGTDHAELMQIRSHQKWFQDHRATLSTFDVNSFPMLGGAAVATSDLSHFSVSRQQKDRLGHVFSVPFYSADGKLRGTVSTILLSHELRRLLPEQNYSLVNTRYNFVSKAHESGQERRSARWVEIGAPDPKLAASNIIELNSFDPRSKWRLWSGLPNKAFHDSSAYETITLFETGGYIGLVLLLTLLLFIQWLEVARNKANRATKMAAKTRLAHQKTLEAEREARRLNEELKANMQMLSDTQLELVKHERLAALGQVTATLSHEIRNPLGAIRSSLYIIRQAALKAELKLDRPIDRIERSVSRCDNLIGDFLEYTRTNELSFQSVDSTEFLNLLLDDQAFPNEITVRRDFLNDGPHIDIDPDRFRSVIINLVENAAQAISGHRDDGGEITVSCRGDELGTQITVSDNGPGIPDEVLAKIFEPLFTTKSFGAGLGLATVNQLVEQHGAELTIETDVGVGTTFKVQLRPHITRFVNSNSSNIEEKAA